MRELLYIVGLVVHCRTITSNKSKECKYVMEFPLSQFIVLTKGLSAYEHGTGNSGMQNSKM